MSDHPERDPPSGSTSATRLVAPPGGDAPDVAALLEEMRRRWEAGEQPAAEEFLWRRPELWQHAGAALKLISEEFRLRRGRGAGADPADYYRRFPAWRSQLEVLLPADPGRGPDGPAARVPPGTGPSPGAAAGEWADAPR